MHDPTESNCPNYGYENVTVDTKTTSLQLQTDIIAHRNTSNGSEAPYESVAVKEEPIDDMQIKYEPATNDFTDGFEDNFDHDDDKSNVPFPSCIGGNTEYKEIDNRRIDKNHMCTLCNVCGLQNNEFNCDICGAR